LIIIRRCSIIIKVVVLMLVVLLWSWRVAILLADQYNVIFSLEDLGMTILFFGWAFMNPRLLSVIFTHQQT